ncbi:MAG: formate dehydrogenase subunit delta [Aestuariivirga sp.]
METRDMVRMANQIADFFRGYPHDNAVKETAEHINRFWAPRMRRAFFDHMAKGGEGFDPLVKDCATLVRRVKADAA